MTRTAIRYALSALAAAALVSTFATGPAVGQSVQMSTQLMNELQNTPDVSAKKRGKTPKGLATRKDPRGAPKGAAITSPVLSGFSPGGGHSSPGGL